MTDERCKCCGLAEAEPGDPDGFCTDCGVECANWVGSGCPGLAEDDEPQDPVEVRYVVDFEPGLFGPFLSRDEAGDWASAYTRGNGSWTVRPLSPAAASPVPGQQREAVHDVLRQHHPIMRSETGPLSGCRCGQVGLGRDVIAHVADAVIAVLNGEAW